MSKIEFEKNWLYGYVLYFDSGQNRLYTTFPNIFLLLSADPADLSYIQKNHFSKKIHDFSIENLL